MIKHPVKLKVLNQGISVYFFRLILGTVPSICYIFMSHAVKNYSYFGLDLQLPRYLLEYTLGFFLLNTILLWYYCPLSFSSKVRLKHKLRKVIEVNKLYYENSELKKITLSLTIKFYWVNNTLYLEVYPNGGQFTKKVDELGEIFQSALNMTVISVQNDSPNHTTYLLRDETFNVIDATKNWG